MKYESTSLKINEAEQIQGLLMTNMINYSYIGYDKNKVTVFIEHGDWKHDHALAKSLILVTFPKSKICTTITEDTGGDCYSAKYNIYF